MVTLLPRRLRAGRATKLSSTSLKGFGGGWNAVDDDISMSPRYLVEARNVRRTPSGAQRVRFGTKWRADIASTFDGTLIDMRYFNGRIVFVTTAGQVGTMTDAGVLERIWDETIASALPSAPSGWATGTTQVDFVPFKDTLIIHNGVDKPISIDSAFDVTYLQDLATGSNVNVPIGKYGCVVGNYHVVGGIPATPTTIYVSSLRTAGVFPGDAAPNDSISFDVGALAPEGGAAIRGLAGFRNFLLVFFRANTALIELGNYDADGVHVPQFPDTLPEFGLLSHRTKVVVGQDLIFGDANGLNSARRNLFGSLDTDQLSELIHPEWSASFGSQTESALQEGAFTVFDHLANELITFCPDGCTFVFAYNEKLRYKAWSHDSTSTWTCGCTSFLGRVFFGEGTRIYQLGNSVFGELYYADKVYDRDGTWLNNTAYTVGSLQYDSVTDEVYECLVNHTSAATGSFATARAMDETLWALYEGRAIDFELELPWLDGQEDTRVKILRYLNITSKGYAGFTVEAYVDNLYKDETGAVVHAPALTMDFVGNDKSGFGYDDGPYGGGRRSGDPRLWRYPAKFKRIKFRLFGSVMAPLEIIGLSFLYAKGSYKR